VTGKNVKDSSLSGKDIKNNSVTGKDVKGLKSGDVTDGSLLGRDFRAGQLPAGPRGATGPRGLTGLRGATGPTTAAISGQGFGTPSASDTAILAVTTSLTTPTQGKLYVEATLSKEVLSCDTGTCDFEYGLRVDGNPVPETKRTVSGVAAGNPVTRTWTITGITGSLPAGFHIVDLALNNSGSNPSTSNPGATGVDRQVSVIALGE
jgi:hypothetical protein